MVYLAELLVVMTDGLKIVRIYARNVPSFSHLSRSRKATVSRADAPTRCRPVETQKNRLQTTYHVWRWPLSKKVAATVCRLHFDTKSEQSDCNKSSVM